MEEITIHTEFIKLGQLLKLSGLCGSGTDAKFIIAEGLVKVNAEVDTRRGKKIVHGDVVEFEGQKIKVLADV